MFVLCTPFLLLLICYDFSFSKFDAKKYKSNKQDGIIIYCLHRITTSDSSKVYFDILMSHASTNIQYSHNFYTPFSICTTCIPWVPLYQFLSQRGHLLLRLLTFCKMVQGLQSFSFKVQINVVK
jgi:hypothetical protein